MAPLSAIAVDNATVLVAITLVVLPIAAVAFALSGPAWRSIGKGRFAIEQELPPRPSTAAGRHEELRAEIRQLVIVRNERRLRRGEAPLDVEAETERQLSDCIGSD